MFLMVLFSIRFPGRRTAEDIHADLVSVLMNDGRGVVRDDVPGPGTHPSNDVQGGVAHKHPVLVIDEGVAWTVLSMLAFTPGLSLALPRASDAGLAAMHDRVTLPADQVQVCTDEGNAYVGDQESLARIVRVANGRIQEVLIGNEMGARPVVRHHGVKEPTKSERERVPPPERGMGALV